MLAMKIKDKDSRAVRRGLWLADLRKKTKPRKKTLKEVGVYCGVTGEYIRQIEAGDIGEIGGSVQNKLADLYGLRSWQLDLDPRPEAPKKEALQAVLTGIEAGLQATGTVMAPDKKSALVAALLTLYRDTHNKQDISEATTELLKIIGD